MWRVCHGQTKKNGEVFRRHTFPQFWLMNSKLTKVAVAAGPRVEFSHIDTARAARFVACEVEFTESGE
jgi:hypothetical protein